MTDQTSQPLTEQQLDDQAVQILSNEGAQCGACGDEPGDRACPDCEKCRAGYVAALRAAGWGPRDEAVEVRRLQTRVAELEEAQRLEWMSSQAVTPHTPRLCVCGHSHHAHTVPSPHSCFAHGKTCPCPAYRQLPHGEAMAQLARNFEAAEGAQR